jgi:hypothetical protein
MDKVATAIGAFLVFCVIMVLIGLIVGYPIKWLWNWLMPDLFPSANIAEITFWQALGMWLLGGFLFKGSSTSNNSKKSG